MHPVHAISHETLIHARAGSEFEKDQVAATVDCKLQQTSIILKITGVRSLFLIIPLIMLQRAPAALPRLPCSDNSAVICTRPWQHAHLPPSRMGQPAV
jgi:hypothetical protein